MRRLSAVCRVGDHERCLDGAAISCSCSCHGRRARPGLAPGWSAPARGLLNPVGRRWSLESTSTGREVCQPVAKVC